MVIFSILPVITILSVSSFAQMNVDNVISNKSKYEKIDELITGYFDQGMFNGFVLVAENGNVIFKKGYCYANIEWKILNSPDTKFRLGSITKQFTSMIIMHLVEDGKISLEGKLAL